MSVLSSFNSLDKRFAWSFLGFVLASVFGGITIYTEFFKVNTPSVVVEIINDANVLDVKEEINELKVFYGDVDIKSLNQTLSVLFLRIKNDGGAPVLNGYYDRNYPFNIILKDGKFLKVEQFAATNEYLRTAAQPNIAAEKSIQLPEVILEPTESYTIKILALHNADSSIEVDVVGKIAGTKEIKLNELNAEETELSFWGAIFYGDIGVQLVRLPIYFFGFILGLTFIIVPIAIASDVISKRKRKRVVEQYKEYAKEGLLDFHDEIFAAYINYGLSTLAEGKELLADKRNWKGLVNAGSVDTESIESPATRLLIEQGSYSEHPSVYRKDSPSRLIRQIGALSKSENNEINLDAAIESSLSKFIDFVVIKES